MDLIFPNEQEFIPGIVNKFREWLRKSPIYKQEAGIMIKIKNCDIQKLQFDESVELFDGILFLHSLYDGNYDIYGIDERRYLTYYDTFYQMIEERVMNRFKELNIPQGADEEEEEFIIEEIGYEIDDYVCELSDKIQWKYFDDEKVKFLLMEREPSLIGI